MSLEFSAVEAIKKTRSQIALSDFEIRRLVQGYSSGEIPDYQMSAWLMAVLLKGLTSQETLALTMAMLHSGEQLQLSDLPHPKVDKHSTGGIGDKTSLIIAPIVASFGIAVPMMSGRGLGHTGGTLDKLESIPGFNTQLEPAAIRKQLIQIGLCFMGQTNNICPADKKMYALRDVTGTVESIDLISASIMSKKLAEDIDGLVLDIKFGSGAFMKTAAKAMELARSLKKIGEGAGKKVTALLTNMNQPLGAFTGNALETFECLEILQNKQLFNTVGTDLYGDTRELSLTLAAYMILMGGKATSLEQAIKLSEDCLRSGRAMALFEKVCLAQGGSLSQLPKATHSIEVRSPKGGFIERFSGEEIGMLGIRIGAGRKKLTDSVDPTAGFKIHFKVGDYIEPNEVLWTIYGSQESNLLEVQKALLDSVSISSQKPISFQLINDILI